ncbi:hypothetical protein JTE90_015758 [Oedothorax gibbosus]|uniref:Uncharacterized protein n=1 Tax=Oedothorax gibbosus TaxID=931172 RepID=A0AAV6VYQ3_9ARAC|nr:hypothetical protein JTE90_015758 [Oedothorax gibbosus]
MYLPYPPRLNLCKLSSKIEYLSTRRYPTTPVIREYAGLFRCVYLQSVLMWRTVVLQRFPEDTSQQDVKQRRFFVNLLVSLNRMCPWMGLLAHP